VKNFDDTYFIRNMDRRTDTASCVTDALCIHAASCGKN